jgi:cell division protein FtsB
MAAARAQARRTAGAAMPRHHRRVSGPLRPVAVPGGAPARPASRPAPRRAPRGRTGGFERVRALPDHRIVDGLLRSRAWIVVIAVLLGGIVAMQVSLLKLNAGISRAVQTTGTLERQNADMADRIARLSSGERVRSAAAQAGMVAPPAGEIGFLRSRGERDAALAAQRLQPPSAEAQALMAAGGRAVPVSTTTTTTTSPVPTTTTSPAAPAGTTATEPVAGIAVAGQG